MIREVDVPGRLTKPATPCKTLLAGILCAVTTGAAAVPPGEETDLRDCIAAAATPAAITACETTRRAAVEARIERWTAAIHERLGGRDRLTFERNVAAWQAFLESEKALLALTFRARRDGLGPQLEIGAVSRLYEDRERQLREHLDSLRRAAPATRP